MVNGFNPSSDYVQGVALAHFVFGEGGFMLEHQNGASPLVRGVKHLV